MTDIIPFEEQKKLSLEILADFARFCDAHDLRYFLAYGTLIGAVRHGGYIPWDDDIDVQMPRADYDRLIELYNREKTVGYYELIAPTDRASRHSIVKIIDRRTLKLEEDVKYVTEPLGIDIDVFPLDGQPEDDAEYKAWYAELQKVYKWHRHTIIPFAGSAKRRAAILLAGTLKGGRGRILAAARRLHARYPYEGSTYVGSVESEHNSIKNRYPRACFEGTIEMDFECYRFKAPIGYDEILTQMYGDYMKLPPKEAQVTHHINKVYYK